MAKAPGVRESTRDRVVRAVRRVRLSLEPSPAGLPSAVALLWFPALVFVVLAVATALEISGTSSGAHWGLLGTGTDPRLILGHPRGIRSDEWLVQQSWLVSQVNQGFPATNGLLPGGMDATVLNELPTMDWSTIFRPQLWGFLFFGLDVGMAWEWWTPVFLLVSAAYAFAITLMPRRPVFAACIAMAVWLTPFLQWWYPISTLWSVAWPLLALAGLRWMLRTTSIRVRVAWAVAIGYFAITTAMGLYFPFIFSGALVALIVGAGLVVTERALLGVSQLLRRLVPLGVAALAAVSVIGVWIATRLPAIEGIADTVYPGHRDVPTGDAWTNDPGLVSLFGAPWNAALRSYEGATPLGPNASEASSVLMFAVFLLPAMIWVVVGSIKKGRRFEWLALSVLVTVSLALLYLLLPGWDFLAKLLQLSRIPDARFRIIFVVLLPVSLVVVAEALTRRPWRSMIWPAAASSILAALLLGNTWATLTRDQANVLTYGGKWWVLVSILTVFACLAMGFRRLAPAGAAAVLIASAVLSVGVNPLYRGVFDLSKTRVGQAVQRLDVGRAGSWVGVGSYETMAVLVESAKSAYDGVQSHPSETMWEQIDARKAYEDEWNRLGRVQWTPGVGAPKVSNPAPDVIEVSFDSCAQFAQRHVEHVLSDAPIDQSCLAQREVIQQGQITFRIYDVVPKSTVSG